MSKPEKPARLQSLSGFLQLFFVACLVHVIFFLASGATWTSCQRPSSLPLEDR